MRLKHFVSVLLMLLAMSIGNVWATDVIFTPGESGSWTTTGGSQTFSKSGVTIATANGAYNSSNSDLRVYKNNTLTIESTVGNISNITFQFSGSNNGGWSTSYSPNAATWESPTASGTQARMTSITVTVTSGASVLNGLTISETPTKKNYENIEKFDVTGLVVTGSYSNSTTSAAVTSGISWKVRTNSTSNDEVSLENYTLTTGQTSLDVQAIVGSIESEWYTVSGLTVNEHIVTPGEYQIFLNNAFYGTTEGANVTPPVSNKQNDITVISGKNSGTAPRTDANQIRYYNGSYLTFSVPTGYVIKSIAFYVLTTGGQWDGNITVNTGTYTNNTKSWVGNANSVTFTFGAQNRIAIAEVTYEVDQKYAVNLSATNGTLTAKYYNDNTSFTSGTEVYDGTKLVLTATPGTTYVGGTITVKKASDNSVVTNAYVASTGILTVPAYAINVEATFTPTYAISAANVTGGTFGWTDVDNNVVSCARAEEGTNIQASNEADGAHNFESYDIYYMDGTNKVNVDNTDGLFTMPAHDVIISGSFTSKPCTPLANATNIGVSGTAYPYDAVTVTWDAVTNADYYVVEVGSGNNMQHSDNLTTTTYTVPTTLAANTTYEYRVFAYSNTPATYCYSMVSNQFTTGDYPAATVTLNDASGVPYALSGNHKLTDVVTLPNTAATCSKNFVGWTATQGSTSAPEYNEANNYSYTISATTQNLYAVYADGGSTNGTITKTMSEIVTANSYTVSSGNNATMYKTLALNSDITLSTTGEDNCGSFWNSGTEWRLYQNKSGNAIVTAASGCTLTSVKFTFGVSNTGALLKGSEALTSGTAVSASGSSATYTVGNSGSATNGQVKITAIEVKYTKGGAYSNYTTECTASPEAVVDPEEINATYAAVANGVIDVTYSHVNTTNVAVALFNNQACTEAFTGEWLTASLNNDNDIAYTIAENTSYNDVRTAYIKLTAPETNGATDPAVFASLEELVAANVNANTNVTVTFSDVTIKEMYEYNDKVCGVVFDIQKDNADIKIYFNNQETITDWVPGGTLSGTLTDCPWKTYSSAWQLAPANNSGWAWANLTYEEPATVSSVVVEGNPTKTEYIDGQTFSPAGLTVTVNYSNSTSQVNPVGVTFSQHVLTQGTTSINVVASYNNVSSDEYEVTGLTVNPIPNKTINEFITAEGTRCYLTGVVSNYSNKTKGYFNLTDATGTIYIYGCTSPSSFDAGDKVKVLAEVYEYYQSTTHEAKNVQYVSKVPAATITIANKIMEVGDEPWTIEATTDPEGAASHLSYSIKAGSDDCITLSEGVVTATAQGTATIIASVQDGDDYMANSVEFTVTVNPAAVHTNVVIYAYYGGHYYALTNAVEALEFTVNNNKIIVHNDAEKDAIIWDHAVRGTEHTFYNAASGKYLKGSTYTTLTASIGATGDHYIWQEYANGAYLTTTATAQTVRTILYRNGYGFKNYDVNNAGASGYANPGITTAEVVVDEQVVRNGLTPGKYGTICLEKNVVSFTGATMYSIDSKASDLSYITLEEETGALEAGRPYIFLATGSEIKVQYGTTTADAGSYNGLVGSFTREQLAEGMYIIQNNKFYRTGADNYVGAHKAYIDMTNVPEETTPVPGRRYVTMQIGDVQTPTALDEVTVNQENAKFILNGQLYILRDGKLYNAQGQLVK